MSAIKNNELPGTVIYFDSESRVDLDDSKYIDRVLAGERVEKEHDTFLICACFTRSTNKNDKWQDYYKGDFKRDFWKDVDQYTKPGQKTWIYAHNAKYDVLATGGVYWLVQLGYTVKSFSDDNPFILKLVKRDKGKTKTILILSSTNYYHNSIAQLGDTFNIPKLPAAFNDEDINEVIKYCRRDVLVMKTAVEGLIQFVLDDDLGTFSQTIAGQAFSAYRHRFMKHDIYIHADARALEVERESYCGGRTESWFIGDVPGKVYGVDVNSEYPSVMINQVYPVYLRTIRNTLSLDDAQQFINDGFLLVARCRVSTDIPIFPVKAGRLIFPTGQFWTTLATPELLEGLRRGLIEELKDVCIYDAAPIFADYVEFFYNKRLDAKAAGDDVRNLLLKLMLNSLYGKFGQKAIDWELIGDAPQDQIKTERVYNADNGKHEMIKIFGGGVFKNIQKTGVDAESANSFPAIAAHVTSYARMLLWRYIETAGPENIYYMDTDSLFTNETGYNNLLAGGAIDNNRLGALKLEKTGDLVIYGVKDYVFNGKAKMKGIPASAIPLNDDTFLCNTWVGVSQMLREGRLNGYKNILVKKHLSRKYEKGYITDTGRVLPLNFTDGVLYTSPDYLNNTDLMETYCKDQLKEEKRQDRECRKLEKELRKQFRRVIKSLGGVNDPDYSNIPKWAVRKRTGRKLDELAGEVTQEGFPCQDGDELYNRILEG